jgi:hypothetical protein
MAIFTRYPAAIVATWEDEARPRRKPTPAPCRPTPPHPAVFDVLRLAWIRKHALRDWIERGDTYARRRALVLNLLDEQITAIEAVLDTHPDWFSVKWNLQTTAAAQRAAIAERVKGFVYSPSLKE